MWSVSQNLTRDEEKVESRRWLRHEAISSAGEVFVSRSERRSRQCSLERQWEMYAEVCTHGTHSYDPYVCISHIYAFMRRLQRTRLWRAA